MQRVFSFAVVIAALAVPLMGCGGSPALSAHSTATPAVASTPVATPVAASSPTPVPTAVPTPSGPGTPPPGTSWNVSSVYTVSGNGDNFYIATSTVDLHGDFDTFATQKGLRQVFPSSMGNPWSRHAQTICFREGVQPTARLAPKGTVYVLSDGTPGSAMNALTFCTELGW